MVKVLTPEQQKAMAEAEAEAQKNAPATVATTQGKSIDAQPGPTWGDLGKSAATGARESAEGGVGVTGDLPAMGGQAVNWLSRKTGVGDPAVAGKATEIALQGFTSPGTKLVRALQVAGIISPETAAKIIGVQAPGSPEVGAVTDAAVKQLPEAVSGPVQDITRHKAMTPEERAAETFGNFAIAGALPGTAAQRVARAVVPTLTTETAGEVAHAYAPEYEPAIRLVMAAVTGGLTAAGENAAVVRNAAKQIQTDPAALARVTSVFEQSGMTHEQALQKITDLGGAGQPTMPMDINPNLLQEGQRIVARGGGPGRTTITNRVADRAEATPQRVKADVTAELGPATSPTQYEAQIKAGQQALSPEYKAALQSPGVKPVDAQAIDAALQNAISKTVGDTEAALTKVAGFIRDKNGALSTDPEKALAARHEIDQIMKSPQTGDNTRHFLQEARNVIDDQLKVAVPGIKNVDAKYAVVSQRGDAFTEGTKSLQQGSKWPEDIQTDITQKGAHWAEGLREGVRSQIEDIIGNKGYNATGLKQAIKGDGTFNRDKLEMLFGKDKADQIGQVLKREQTYQRSHVRLTEQSPTAERAPQISADEKAQLFKDVPVAYAAGHLPGAAIAVAKNISQRVIDNFRQQRAIARDTEVANLLTSNEPTTVLRGIQLAQQRGAVLPSVMRNALLSRQFDKGQ
jgi:hypothetical protein